MLVKRKIYFFFIGFGILYVIFGGNFKDCVDFGRSGFIFRENGKNGKEKILNYFIIIWFMCEVFLFINVIGDWLWYICNLFFLYMVIILYDKNNFLKYCISLIYLIWIFIWMCVFLYRDISWILFDIERKWKLKVY